MSFALRSATRTDASGGSRRVWWRASSRAGPQPTTGFLVYPLFERDALLDEIRKAPEFVQFMTELKATVDGYRREFEGR